MGDDPNLGFSSENSASSMDERDHGAADYDSTSASPPPSGISAAPESSSSVLQDQHRLMSEWNGSLVEYYGPSASYCGYCKSMDPTHDGGRRTYDMQAYRLTAEDYQAFLDRGWRRSGESCYCPINQTTCCPNYPISCQAIRFRLSRSQRKCIEHLNNYLYTGSTKTKSPIVYDDLSRDLFRSTSHIAGCVKRSFDEIKQSSKARDRRFVKACERKSKINQIPLDEAIEMVRNKWSKARPPDLRLEDYLYPRKMDSGEDIVGRKHNLEINMFHVDSEESKALREDEHRIMVKYQKVVHNENRREWSMSRYCDFLVKTPIITAPLSNYDYIEDLNHQLTDRSLSVRVHSDQEPFVLLRPPQLPTAFGTYHCSYHLDRKLIAVGVLDVLPKCITTVYFFYDPEYSFLNLGVYSALTEISMVRQMYHRFKPDSKMSRNILDNYHLGYYVHECKKMHYKTRYRPSYLLCCKTYEYVPTEECLLKLKDRKYSDFKDVEQSVSENPDREAIEFQKLLEVSIEWPLDIQHTTTASHAKLLNYILWLETEMGTEYVELFVNGYLATFAHLIGPELIAKICLKLNVVHRTLMRRRERLNQQINRKHKSSSRGGPTNDGGALSG